MLLARAADVRGASAQEPDQIARRAERIGHRHVAIGGHRGPQLTPHLGDEVHFSVHFSVPVGGHHVWVTFKRPIEEQSLYLEALRAGVTYTPGSATTVEPSHRTSLRLSFGLCTPEELDDAVRRLATAVRSARRLERRAASFPVS